MPAEADNFPGLDTTLFYRVTSSNWKDRYFYSQKCSPTSKGFRNYGHETKIPCCFDWSYSSWVVVFNITRNQKEFIEQHEKSINRNRVSLFLIKGLMFLASLWSPNKTCKILLRNFFLADFFLIFFFPSVYGFLLDRWYMAKFARF